MHFAVVKLSFEATEPRAGLTRKDVAALVEKLRARFRIVIMAAANAEDDGETVLAYTSLAHSEESLTKQMDAIAEFCEEAGCGRVADEAVLMDHIDCIGLEDTP